MSQIIAIHREDDHEIDFAWDSFVGDTEFVSRVISWKTPKVERFCLPGGTEMAIGVTGLPCLLQALTQAFPSLLDALPAPTAKGIINFVVPWIREVLTDCGMFSDGQISVGGDSEHSLVIGIASDDMSELALISNSLSVVCYEQPIVCIGACSMAALALYQDRLEEGLSVDRRWMERALRICAALSPFVSPPWCGCTIGGRK